MFKILQDRPATVNCFSLPVKSALKRAEVGEFELRDVKEERIRRSKNMRASW